MRAFKKLLLAALLVWLSGIVLVQASLYLPFRLWVGGDSNWMRALDGRTGCRIYLIGSSAVLYGLSAEQIEEATGCGVINTALAGIGTQVTEYLVLVLKRVRPDDVVVLSDRDWLSQGGVEKRCHFEDPEMAWLSSLPRLVPNLRDLMGHTTGVVKTSRGDLAVFPTYTGPRFHMSAKDVRIGFDCRLKVLQHQLKIIAQAGAIPIIAPPPMLTTSKDMPELQAELQTLGRRLSSGMGSGSWIAPRIETDLRYFTLEGQHTSGEGRQRWTDDVVRAVRRLSGQITK